MKRLFCLLLAMLLLAGCTAEPEPTESKGPGWSVEWVGATDENGGTVQENLPDNEEIISEEDASHDGEMIGGGSSNVATNPGVFDTSVSISDDHKPGVEGSVNLSLEERRQLVVEEMREMMTLLWTPDRDITYYITGLQSQPVAVTLKKGTVYQGMPYTNGAASRYSFLSCATQENNGVYTLSGLNTDVLSGNGVPRLGNSCSSALFWAWGRVCNSVTYTNTQQMTQAYGCLPVGDYTTPYDSYGKQKSVDICKENGEQVMFESYAKMLPGDGMVRRTGSGGHAIMVVDVNIVRFSDGSIDAEASTATIIDQSETRELNQKTTNVPGVGSVVVFQDVDVKRTFAWLYKSGYLPVTCKELIDPAPLTEAKVTDYTKNPTVDNMFSGVLRSTYRISSVTVTVQDSAGKTVQKATCYGVYKELYEFNMYRFTQANEKSARQGEIDINALPAGTYRVIFTCRLSTGDTLTFRDFIVTK